MSRSKPAFIEGSIPERVFVAIVSPLLAVIYAEILYVLCTGFTGPVAQDWRERIMGFVAFSIFSELMAAPFLLLVLAFFWALFRPAWLERMMSYARDHVWHSMCFFLIGSLVVFVICITMP